MLDPHSLLLFVAAGLVLNLTPGPDLLYVTARSLSQGFRAGAASSLGIAAGCLVHTLLAALGISALLHSAPLAYDALRLAGAGYLMWLGAQALRRGSARVAAAPLAPTPLPAIFVQGVVTNVLNPKVALFVLAFLPQFADPARGNFALQIVLLGVIFIANGLWVCLAVAWGAARAARWVGGRRAWLHRGSGVMLLGLGVHLAISKGLGASG